MDANSLTEEVHAFEAKLEDFYDAFQRSKKAFLDEATNEPLRIENEKLRRMLKASDDENDFLKRDLQSADSRIEELERDLDAKKTLLSTIGAYVTGESAAAPKRERSQEADRERSQKRARDDYSQDTGYQGYQNGNYTDRPDSGVINGSQCSRNSASTVPSAPTSYANPPPHHAYTPAPAGYASGNNQPSPPGLNIVGAAQHSKPFLTDFPVNFANTSSAQYSSYQANRQRRSRPRRIVCHECYAKRRTCDLDHTCRHCREAGLQCVRTLCKAFQGEKGCYRMSGDCFKVHDEQGYYVTDEDPFSVTSASRPT